MGYKLHIGIHRGLYSGFKTEIKCKKKLIYTKTEFNTTCHHYGYDILSCILLHVLMSLSNIYAYDY